MRYEMETGYGFDHQPSKVVDGGWIKGCFLSHGGGLFHHTCQPSKLKKKREL